jgi:NADH-quinone oxidoreductase subunit M
MFLLAGSLYHKANTDDITRFGGLWTLAPAYGALLVFTGMASVGLPGLSEFVGEFQLVAGSWWIFPFYVALGMIGLLFTGAYILKVIQRLLQGQVREEWQGYRLEITTRELTAIAPLIVLMVVTGLYPNWIVTVINATVARLFGA